MLLSFCCTPQTKVEKFFIPARLQAAKIEESKRDRATANRTRKELLMRKRIRILELVRVRYHNVMATRIQKGFREYLERKAKHARDNSLSAKGFRKTASLKEVRHQRFATIDGHR